MPQSRPGRRQRVCRVRVERPGEAESRVKRLTQNPTSSVAPVASRYTNHVAFPASANTSGMVSDAEVDGAIAETDCASVSSGPSTPACSP